MSDLIGPDPYHQAFTEGGYLVRLSCAPGLATLIANFYLSAQLKDGRDASRFVRRINREKLCSAPNSLGMISLSLNSKLL